jgi:deoxyribonuclease-4
MIIMNTIGCHLSIKGSLLNIFEEALTLHIKTIACFTGSNLRYNFNTYFDSNIITAFKKKIDEENYSVFSHACYLINIADIEKTENYHKSVHALTAELQRCDLLGITGVAFHPGSNANRYDGLLHIANTINTIYEKNHLITELYIESSAGEGNKIPSSLEEIQIIINNLSEKALKKTAIVLDTCHIFAAGYDLTSPQAINKFLLDFDTIIGLEKIKLIHLNDSKKQCGSKLDRHETLGKGHIGIENIQYFINNTNIKNIPKILETPVNHYLDWQAELLLLANLLKNDTLIDMN